MFRIVSRISQTLRGVSIALRSPATEPDKNINKIRRKRTRDAIAALGFTRYTARDATQFCGAGPLTPYLIFMLLSGPQSIQE